MAKNDETKALVDWIEKDKNTALYKALKKHQQDYTHPEEDKEVIKKLSKPKKKPFPEKKIYAIVDDLTRCPTPFKKRNLESLEPLLIAIFEENALPIDYRKYKRYFRKQKKVSERETVESERMFPETRDWRKARKRMRYGEEENE